MEKHKKVLIYGIGNPSKQDDAIGIAFTELIQKWVNDIYFSCIDVDSNYQLNIEDADLISKYDIVIFADASVADINEFKFQKVTPQKRVEPSMHSVSPDFVLYLAQEMFQTYPETYVLQIKGYKFELDQDMTTRAKMNMYHAFRDITIWLEKQILKPCLEIHKNEKTWTYQHHTQA
jgi:hydrogenase maturation protease